MRWSNEKYNNKGSSLVSLLIDKNSLFELLKATHKFFSIRIILQKNQNHFQTALLKIILKYKIGNY